MVNGHIHFYEKPEVKKAMEKLYWDLYPFRPEAPFTGKLCVQIVWAFDKKSLTKAENHTFHTKRPDVDNLAKGTLDVMAKVGIITEDAEISRLELRKIWDREHAGLYILIWRLNDSINPDNPINDYEALTRWIEVHFDDRQAI